MKPANPPRPGSNGLAVRTAISASGPPAAARTSAPSWGQVKFVIMESYRAFMGVPDASGCGRGPPVRYRRHPVGERPDSELVVRLEVPVLLVLEVHPRPPNPGQAVGQVQDLPGASPGLPFKAVSGPWSLRPFSGIHGPSLTVPIPPPLDQQLQKAVQPAGAYLLRACLSLAAVKLSCHRQADRQGGPCGSEQAQEGPKAYSSLIQQGNIHRYKGLPGIIREFQEVPITADKSLAVQLGASAFPAESADH